MAGAVALFAGLVGLVGLAGCSSNPEPPPLESASAAPSATPTPTEVPPELPAEAKGTTAASAKAFVRYWIDALNYAGKTGETSRLATASAEECVSCQNIIRRIDEIRSSGGSIQGGGWTLFSINAVSGQPPTKPILEAGVRLSRQVVTPARGDAAQTFRGGRQPMTFRLAQRRGQWVVARLDKVD